MSAAAPVNTPHLRRMQRGDLAAVLRIQLACYGADFVEPDAVFARRLAAAPDTAWVAQRGDALLAYLSAYPSHVGKLTALHGDFEPAPDADTLYLHDLAVHPDAHGMRLGPRLVQHALAEATRRGWRQSALVSVQGSLGFWQRQGYAVQCLGDSVQMERLRGYGDTAQYMVRPVT